MVGIAALGSQGGQRSTVFAGTGAQLIHRILRAQGFHHFVRSDGKMVRELANQRMVRNSLRLRDVSNPHGTRGVAAKFLVQRSHVRLITAREMRSRRAPFCVA